MRDIQLIFESLRSKGCRITVARKAVIQAFFREQAPLSATEIHGWLAKQGIQTDKVTVYRELDFLQAEGLIVSVQFQDRKKRYELAALDHHHHLICEKCERVEDIDLKDDVEAQAHAIARQKQFKVLRHSLEFFGLCKTCR